MFYGGIDVAKYRHEICIVDESGNVILQILWIILEMALINSFIT